MRKFNEREKEIIKYLSLIDENTQKNFGFYLQEIFFKEDKEKALYIDIDEEIASLFLKKEKYDHLEQRKRELFYFIETLSLIQYLRNERLITITSISNTKPKGRYFVSPYFTPDGLSKEIIYYNERRMVLNDKDSQINEEGRVIYTGIHLNDQIYNILANSILGLTFVSEELKYLVENNFETDEEKRFSKNYCLTWAGIIVAFLVGVFGLFNPFTSTVKIEETQYKQAIQQIDELKHQLKTYESKIDSLKVQINNNALTQKSPL